MLSSSRWDPLKLAVPCEEGKDRHRAEGVAETMALARLLCLVPGQLNEMLADTKDKNHCLVGWLDLRAFRLR